MSNEIAKKLFELSEIDKEVAALRFQKKDIEKKQQGMIASMAALKNEVDALRETLTGARGRHEVSEKKLEDEQAKITERRKQLTALGGAKAAKLVEREIDIASRALQALEQVVLDSQEVVERIEGEVLLLEERLESAEQEHNQTNPDYSKSIEKTDSDIADYLKNREAILSGLEDKLRTLYTRVATRYPGDAIAYAVKGACRTCFRSLPAQVFNLIISGSVSNQCPGCSRILIHDEKNG